MRYTPTTHPLPFSVRLVVNKNKAATNTDRTGERAQRTNTSPVARCHRGIYT
jgi:hypothetical protein